MKRDDEILHEKSDPRLQGGRLYSMLDILGPEIVCDECGRWQRLSAILESDAREDANRKGWAIVDGRDLCPICTKSRP